MKESIIQVHTNGDPSVGIFGWGISIPLGTEIYFDDKEYRKELCDRFEAIFTELWDFKAHACFEDTCWDCGIT